MLETILQAKILFMVLCQAPTHSGVFFVSSLFLIPDVGEKNKIIYWLYKIIIIKYNPTFFVGEMTRFPGRILKFATGPHKNDEQQTHDDCKTTYLKFRTQHVKHLSSDQYYNITIHHYPFKEGGRTQIARHILDVFEGGGPVKCWQAFIYSFNIF